MAADVVIRAEGLGKKYVIGHQAEREPYVALRDVIGRTARSLARTTTDMLRGRPLIVGDSTEEFWALKDVSFEVKRGEVLGVIGRNGAGKSTLLKILSRITEPSEGRVEIRGRVASLLEVGTGFHPELTGRENVYLNGAILGMTREEIRRKFDEIVDFSGVEKFLDTPVKRYSSGMYVRLAFAIAAHLEPEILVVDEVLAVGDAEFQKKCLGKLGEVASGGRTVLFVSHNLQAVGSMCSRAIVLRAGAIQVTALANDAIRSYLSYLPSTDEPTSSNGSHVIYDACSDDRRRDNVITRLEVFSADDSPKQIIRSNDYVKFRIWYRTTSARQLSVTLQLQTAYGVTILKLESHPKNVPLVQSDSENFVDCVVECLPLVEGRYSVSFGTSVYGVSKLNWMYDAANLMIFPAIDPALQTSIVVEGFLAVRHKWLHRVVHPSTS